MITPEASEVRELVREWYQAAAGGQLGGGPYSQFISIWIAFNALYAVRFDEEGGDRTQVRAFAKWDRALMAHQHFLNLSDYRGAIHTLAEPGVYNFLSRRPIEILDEADLGNILEAVYQVRCNLFHGRKSAANMRDRGLVEASRQIVYRFVGTLLDDDSVWADIHGKD